MPGLQLQILPAIETGPRLHTWVAWASLLSYPLRGQSPSQRKALEGRQFLGASFAGPGIVLSLSLGTPVIFSLAFGRAILAIVGWEGCGPFEPQQGLTHASSVTRMSPASAKGKGSSS